MLVEVCANSLESALVAEKAGADRIELCSELAVGGVTPSYGLLKTVKDNISIPVRVLIRPRSGDFSYSDEELAIMESNIKLCAEMGFEGVVSGVLKQNFELDVPNTRRLRSAAGGMKFTFHRAFDWIKNPYEAMSELEGLGVDTVLSSGQKKKAMDGIDLLNELNESFSDITIMPGSGIGPDTIHFFKNKGFNAVHLSGVEMQQRLSTNPEVPMNSLNMLSDMAVPVSNFEKIRAVVQSVK